MSDDMFLRLRLPAGVTLATAAPEVREAVRVLVDCKAAALYRGDVSGLTPDSGDVRGAFAAAGKTLAAVGVPEDGEEARAALLQLVNRVDQLEHDEVVVKLARDYWPVISAMFVTDPRRAVSICKLFYWIKKKGSMSHEVDSLLHKNLSLDQAVVTLALMLELDNDTSFIHQVVAHGVLQRIHATFTTDLTNLEHTFRDSLVGKSIAGMKL